MSYLVVDEDGEEWYSNAELIRDDSTFGIKNYYNEDFDRWTIIGSWTFKYYSMYNNKMSLPKGYIEKIEGIKLTWEDEPIEIKDLV